MSNSVQFVDLTPAGLGILAHYAEIGVKEDAPALRGMPKAKKHDVMYPLINQGLMDNNVADDQFDTEFYITGRGSALIDHFLTHQAPQERVVVTYGFE